MLSLQLHVDRKIKSPTTAIIQPDKGFEKGRTYVKITLLCEEDKGYLA